MVCILTPRSYVQSFIKICRIVSEKNPGQRNGQIVFINRIVNKKGLTDLFIISRFERKSERYYYTCYCFYVVNALTKYILCSSRDL